jgi:phosphoglycolate phosphatase
MKDIAGILFDKDGTLLDYDQSWLPVNRELARIASRDDAELADRLLSACGMDPETGAIVPDSLLAAGNTHEIAEGLIAAGSPVPADELIRKLDALFADATAFSVPVTDLAAFFEELHGRGLKLGIASSDNERSIRNLTERFGFARHVDYIAGYDSGFGCKPAPGMLLGFCEAMGIAPANVAMIGDNNHDMMMGINAGAGLKIGVLTGTGSRESLSAAADFCLASIVDILDLLPAKEPA